VNSRKVQSHEDDGSSTTSFDLSRDEHFGHCEYDISKRCGLLSYP